MIFADKLIDLRKKNGWSQEELADKMDVSRQSVSKWESAQAVPSIDKILQLSQLFGVSTDYLLKDDMEVVEPIETDDTPLRKVTVEKANAFLQFRTETAKKISLAIALFIVSPIAIFMFDAAGTSKAFRISEGPAATVGTCLLFVIVAIATVLLVIEDHKAAEYKFLSKCEFDTEYGVSGIVKREKDRFSKRRSHLNAAGIALFILSPVPLFLSSAFLPNSDIVYDFSVSILLALVALGTFLVSYCGTITAGFNILLQEGRYTPEAKAKGAPKKSVFTQVYWAAVLIIYFIAFFPLGMRTYNWVIWVIAAVAYKPLRTLVCMRKNS